MDRSKLLKEPLCPRRKRAKLAAALYSLTAVVSSTSLTCPRKAVIDTFNGCMNPTQMTKALKYFGVEFTVEKNLQTKEIRHGIGFDSSRIVRLARQSERLSQDSLFRHPVRPARVKICRKCGAESSFGPKAGWRGNQEHQCRLLASINHKIY